MKWLRIPHSQFLRFDRADRDKALWWEIQQRETCSSCGTRADEWDPALGGDDNAYRVELRKCWGCDARAKGEKAITESMGAGVYPVLIK